MATQVDFSNALRSTQGEATRRTPNLRLAAAPITWTQAMPVFACAPFLQTLSHEHGWVGGFDENGELRCVQPYAILRKFGIRLVRFPVELFPVGGVIDHGERQAFINALPHFFRSVDVILPAANTALFPAYPQAAPGEPMRARVVSYGTIINDLGRPEQEMHQAVSPDFRRQIRLALKAGVQIKEGAEYLEPVHAMISATLSKAGIEFKTMEHLCRIMIALGENIKVFVAIQGNQIQAATISPFSSYAGYDWYAARAEHAAPGSMHLLKWEIIRHFSQLGVHHYNWAGARVHAEGKQAGIKDFKMRFGGTFVQGYAWKYPIHRIRYAAYCAGMRWLRGGDIVDIESAAKS